MYTRRGGDSTAGSFPNGKRLAKLCATATGGIHPPLGKRVSAPQVVVQVAPQVNVPILGRVLHACPQEPPEVYSNLLPPSVGETTGGIHPHAVRHKHLCPTGGKHPIAPQVDISTAGKHRPARTEDRR